MKIAIVDDERDEPDIQIDTFTCARDLLKIFKPGMYQLIILDIVMPEINGMQAAQVIRARGDNEANIVFLTGSDDYVLNVDGAAVSVPYRNIFYVDIEDGHKLCVHFADKKFVTANSYADIADIC